MTVSLRHVSQILNVVFHLVPFLARGVHYVERRQPPIMQSGANHLDIDAREHVLECTAGRGQP